MSGLIKREDIDQIRDRIRIEDIISAHVMLRPAGVGTLKGLCPFHDEKTPSFSVRTHLGLWHCFGCGKGGDVIGFVQQIHQLSFVEAVQYLADKAGITIEYDTSQNKDSKTGNLRKIILEINNIAKEFYIQNLLSAQAIQARVFLSNKGFSKADCEEFGVGYAGEKWDELTGILMNKGYTQEQLLASGIASRSSNGKIYDRFRQRVMWPIHDVTGQVIGFGARRLDEDSNTPKYLNTAETAVYKKAQVLYGLDMAKKEIVAKKQVVIVEGYTDVMAAHVAGIKNVVATCGTAFGNEHAKILRRLMGDGVGMSSSVSLKVKSFGGAVIFTFDSDEAGQKAALRAFNENQNFVAQTYIALDDQGMDPCDIRLHRGDKALVQMIENKVPLVEFVLKTAIKDLDLSTAEGRSQAKQICTPIVEQIQDETLQAEYARIVSGWIGSDLKLNKKNSVLKTANYRNYKYSNGKIPEAVPVSSDAKKIGDEHKLQEEVLKVVLQLPHHILDRDIEKLKPQDFTDENYRQIYQIVSDLGGYEHYKNIAFELIGIYGNDPQVIYNTIFPMAGKKWVEQIHEKADPQLQTIVSAIANSQIPQDKKETFNQYCHDIITSLVKNSLEKNIMDLKTKLYRMKSTDPQYKTVVTQLQLLSEEEKHL